MSPSPVKIAIFGGSFNPPHVAHLLAVTWVLACRDIDRVLVVPTFQHPFAKSLAPFDDRMEMCRFAFAEQPRVEISAVERELGGESKTVRTLEHLAERHPEWRMRLLVGADLIHELDRWTRPERVKALAPPLVLARLGVAPPPGFEDAPRVLPEVSSTAIRAAFARGERVDDLVPRAVVAYVREHGLYGSPRSRV